MHSTSLVSSAVLLVARDVGDGVGALILLESWRTMVGSMARRACLALAALGLAACVGDPSGGLASGGGVVVLGIPKLAPYWDGESGAIASCTWSGRFVATPIVLAPSEWSELEIPFWVQNGGPERAEGTRRFDMAITPSGVARAAWTCQRAPRPPEVPDWPDWIPDAGEFDAGDAELDAGDGDGNRDAGDTGEADQGDGDAGDAGQGDLGPTDAGGPRYPHPSELTPWLLHRRDVERPFCADGPVVFEDLSSPSVEQVVTGGQRILGGDKDIVTVRLLSRELLQDVDLELRLGALARSCCVEAECAGPLIGAACEELFGELRALSATARAEGRAGLVEPFDGLVQTLADQPRILWAETSVRIEFLDPYGAWVGTTTKLRIGFCRDCRYYGFPADIATTSSDTLDCLAGKFRESW